VGMDEVFRPRRKWRARDDTSESDHRPERIKKKASDLQQVTQAVLPHLPPEQVEIDSCRAEEVAQRRGLTAELDEMGSYVRKKAGPRWLWHAIDHARGTVFASIFGRRTDEGFGP